MRKLATVRRISELRPIGGADRIELALVDGWQAVVKRGDFVAGEVVIYCEIDAFLPVREEFEFLRKSSFKRMGEQAGFRLRTVKLRGQISQGLILPLSTLPGGVDGQSLEIGSDVTAELGIIKYEPPVPACLTGEVVGGYPSTIRKTDEERIQNLAAEYTAYRGLPFYVTEKLDGTSFTAFYDNELGVCGRNWQYANDDKNSYWQIAEQLQLRDKLARLGRRLAVQGELVGPGIQGNRYKLREQQLFVFNVFDMDRYGYLEKTDVNEVCETLQLQQVPFVHVREVPGTLTEILQIAEGPSQLNPQTEREGLVWVHGSGTDRISFKTISNRFLAEEK